MQRQESANSLFKLRLNETRSFEDRPLNPPILGGWGGKTLVLKLDGV
jgi:hypothetical protein